MRFALTIAGGNGMAMAHGDNLTILMAKAVDLARLGYHGYLKDEHGNCFEVRYANHGELIGTYLPAKVWPFFDEPAAWLPTVEQLLEHHQTEGAR